MAQHEPDSVGRMISRLTNDSPIVADGSFLAWPPDTFAVAARLLRDSGNYVKVVQQWPPDSYRNIQSYERQVKQVGERWFKSLPAAVGKKSVGSFKTPKLVTQLWQKLQEFGDKSYRDQEVWPILMQLCAISDEASKSLANFSMFSNESGDKIPWNLLKWILDNLQLFGLHKEGLPTNLCSPNVDRESLTVLPKMRTPQNGITMRSLSHYIALMPTPEVQVYWNVHRFEAEPHLDDGINLLLFPWPSEVIPAQFEKHSVRVPNALAGEFDYFQFLFSGDSAALTSKVTSAYQEARRQFGKIDAVVFPEMALNDAGYSQIHQRLQQEDELIMVGGVYSPPTSESLGKNCARISVFSKPYESEFEFEQHKHHRWMLDGSQLRNYGIGSRLSPKKKWWEAIEIPNRTLSVMQLAPNMVLSVLICEDLARPDPVGDVIRAIGPNLLIALLQDGPQLASRWSARYATVFADDPGCSVLTLTGLGLTRLSRPAGVVEESRVVALWKQADQPARELTLPRDSEALVLCLTNESKGQWTADGRYVKDSKGFLSISGVHGISV